MVSEYTKENTYNSYIKADTAIFNCLKGTIMLNKCTIDSNYTIVAYGSADNDFLVTLSFSKSISDNDFIIIEIIKLYVKITILNI